MKNDNLKLKCFKIFNVIFIFSILAFSLPARAQNMNSDHYYIQWGNFNTGSDKIDSENYQLGITMGQIAPGLYSKTGAYKVRSGFQYIQSLIPFSFTISDTNIDLGYLSVETPKTDTNTLTVSAGGAGGYQVLAYETHPLRLSGESICGSSNCIPDTICDNSNCTESSAEVWTEDTTYGFGFNMENIGGTTDVPTDFANTTYFRQFADNEADETHQVVMSNPDVTKSSSATVTYKANISTSHTGGNYETSIVYIAVPSY